MSSIAVRPSRSAPGGRVAARTSGIRRPISTTHRPLFLLIIMVLCTGGLTARLAFWSVMEHGKLAATAAAQRATLNVQVPQRGLILNAQNQPLAMDVTLDLVYAVPKDIKNPIRTARLLAPILGQSEKRLEDLFAGYAGYVQLAPRVSHQVSEKLRNLALPGIFLYPTLQRVYPEGSTAAQDLGFATVDNKGFDGLEGYYDQILSGKAGLRSIIRDTAGNDIHLSSQPSSPALNGGDLHLTLDRVVQSIVEAELQKAIKVHQADSGTVIVMDPRTGYILGMANYPSFNPNHYQVVAASDPQRLLNAVVSWTYEPGSTFKIITMAAGLDSHVITPNSAFDDTGQFVIGDRVIHNWNMRGFGWETMTQVLQHSANVGASWVAEHLGTSLFYKYVQGFGFGQPTGVDLQGEEAGLLPLPGSKVWTIVNLYTNSFGQGLSVTPLQMIRAVAAVANGGIMMKPQIVKRVVYDGHIFDHPPITVGRVISTQTARTLTHMLVQSAVGGEAALGLVKGYNVAAKTGTANIAGPDGQYIQGATVASIVGYAPAYHPRIAVLVVINHPRDTQWGSMAAAPVLHNIFQDLFMYYGIPPASRSPKQ